MPLETVISDYGLEAYKQMWHRGDGLLVSPVYQCFEWKPGEVQEATCIYYPSSLHGCEEAVSEGCGCGIYAMKTLDDLTALAYRKAEAVDKDFMQVIARLNLWGRVYLHSKGYRAQKARIRELYFECGERSEVHLCKAGELESKYRVPVHFSVLPQAGREAEWV